LDINWVIRSKLVQRLERLPSEVFEMFKIGDPLARKERASRGSVFLPNVTIPVEDSIPEEILSDESR
jgi:hypothetical protein